jgi:hypothetical protein
VSNLDFEESRQSRKTAWLVALLMLGIAVSYFGIKSTLAANISINSGAAVEFGQGFTGATSCSGGQSITITPNSSFTNAGGTSGTFYFSSFRVSNIPAGCSGSDFTLKAFDSQTASTALSLFNTSTTNAVVSDASGVYSAGAGSTGMTVVTNSATSFTATFTTPVASAKNVYKITVESGSHTMLFGDVGPTGGIIFITPASLGGTGGSYYYEAAPNDLPGTYRQCNNAFSFSNRSSVQGIGYGRSLTTSMLVDCTVADTAIYAANAYSNGSTSDYFLPSLNELTQLCKYATFGTETAEGVQCNYSGTVRSGFRTGTYWAAASISDPAYGLGVTFNLGIYQDRQSVYNYVRPVRRFLP